MACHVDAVAHEVCRHSVKCAVEDRRDSPLHGRCVVRTLGHEPLGMRTIGTDLGEMIVSGWDRHRSRTVSNGAGSILPTFVLGLAQSLKPCGGVTPRYSRSAA